MRWSNNKYKAVKTTIDGITFDSKREAKRYTELKLLEKSGMITHLELQPKYDIIINGAKYAVTGQTLLTSPFARTRENIQELERRMDSSHEDRGQGGADSRGCQRLQDTYLSFEKETGGGLLSRYADQGSITLGQFMHFFDKVSPMPLHEFALHKKARAEHLRFRALFTAVARRLGRFSLNQIGTIFNKDHASILHYTKRHEELVNEDDSYALIYMDLEENIKRLMDEKYGNSDL